MKKMITSISVLITSVFTFYIGLRAFEGLRTEQYDSICQGGAVPDSGECMHQFWLYPDLNAYVITIYILLVIGLVLTTNLIYRYIIKKEMVLVKKSQNLI